MHAPQQRMIGTRKRPFSEQHELAIPVPDGMDAQQAEAYRNLIRISRQKSASFEELASEIIASDPKLATSP